MKVPKQWKHWCQKAGLKRYGRKGTRKGRYIQSWYYLVGHGRVWRLNCHGRFECGDTLAEFDRWALCDIESAEMPTSLYEFVVTVKTLLSEKEANGKIK